MEATDEALSDAFRRAFEAHPDREISYHPQSGWFDEGPQRGPSGNEGR